jgi:tetratricopeptide (TPR) repeat protein
LEIRIMRLSSLVLLAAAAALCAAAPADAQDPGRQRFDVPGVTLPTHGARPGGLSLLGVEAGGPAGPGDAPAPKPALGTIVVLGAGHDPGTRKQVKSLLDKGLPAGVGGAVIAVPRGGASAFSDAAGRPGFSVQEIDPAAWQGALGRHGFQGLPAVFLVDADGFVVRTWTGAQDPATLAGGAAPPAPTVSYPRASVFVFGIHLSSFGVLSGLNRDVAVAQRPGTMDILRRNLKWALDAARGLQMPAASLERLQADLEGIGFADMERRMGDIISEHQQFLLPRDPIAAGVLSLGIQVENAEALANHVREFARHLKPGTGKLIRDNLGYARTSLDNLQLPLSRDPLEALIQTCDGGGSFADMAGKLEQLRLLWQGELGGVATPAVPAGASPGAAPSAPPGSGAGVDPASLRRSAEEALARGDAAEAAKAFSDAITRDASSQAAWAGRAKARARSGDYAGAAADLRAALERKPAADAGLFESMGAQTLRADLAEMLIAGGKLDEAEAETKRHMETGVPDAASRVLLGQIALKRGDAESARREFAQAAAILPDIHQIAYRRGGEFLEQGRFDRALTQFDTVEMLSPGLAPVHFARGTALAGLGRKADAVAAFRAYLELDAASEWADKAREQIEALGR